MRKLLLILLLFSSVCQAQIGWGSLTSNQWVSFQDAQGSGIFQKNPLPNGTNWMTKQAVMYYLNIDTSYLAGMPKNQLVTKSQLVGITTANLNWSFTKTSYAGGGYLQITVNYSSVVYVDDLSQSGSLTINDGDVVTVNVSMNGYVAYGTSNVSISSTRGLAYNVPVTGIDVTASQTFTYHNGNGVLNIEGSMFTGTGLYYNAAYSNVFFKNDCGTGYTGSTVTYTIPANTYTSNISQEDADMKAITTVNYNGPAYANANGSCIAIPPPGSQGCTNSLIVSYNPSPAQDYGDGLVYLAYILINGYEIDTYAAYATRYNKPIHDGDSIVIKIHMPSSTKGITGVNINYKDDSNKSLLQIASVIVNATTAGLGQFLLSTLLNVLSFGLSQGTTTQIHQVVTVPYDIYIRMKYSCDKGNINIIISNMIDIN